MRKFLLVFAVLACFSFSNQHLWGFYGHRKITRMAIYTLPQELISFYKQNAELIIEKSVAPDQRRYVIPEEGPRHYIDLDEYANPDSLPKYWFKAIEKFGEDTLLSRGIVPWYAYYTYKQLVKAFSENNYPKIIRKSSDLAHYLADANVPLHTTSNYNGQQTGQNGIHGFWETRLPQLYSDGYDFLVGQANYLSDPQQAIWDDVLQAHALVDSVFIVERMVTAEVGESRKFAYEDRGRRTVKVYSEKFSQAYHQKMPVVEQQMRKAIKLIGDCWFSAWVDAVQPDINNIEFNKPDETDSLKLASKIIPVRNHEH